MSVWQTRFWLLSPWVSSLPGRVSCLVISGLKTPSQGLAFRKYGGPRAQEVKSDKEKSELDLPNHQLFLKGEIPIPWLYLLSHCSCGISQHLHLKQSLGSKSHPDFVRCIQGTFEDESNERKYNCFFQDFRVFAICAPLIQDIIIHSFQSESRILLICGRGCCSQELKPPFYCCTRSKGIITIYNTKRLKGNCFI